MLPLTSLPAATPRRHTLALCPVPSLPLPSCAATNHHRRSRSCCCRGTSFATPLVSATAALLFAAAAARGQPADYLQVKEAILATVDPHVALRNKVAT